METYIIKSDLWIRVELSSHNSQFLANQLEFIGSFFTFVTKLNPSSLSNLKKSVL